MALPIIAPNALGSVVEQFQPHKLGVATVSDRVSDYDAIRPDVLSHLAFGRGFGSMSRLYRAGKRRWRHRRRSRRHRRRTGRLPAAGRGVRVNPRRRRSPLQPPGGG